MPVKRVHDELIRSITRDLTTCDIKGDGSPRWGGRRLLIDKEIGIDLYVRFIRNSDNELTYVIASIYLPDNLCGYGLLSKIIDVVKLCAPVEMSGLAFECVGNARLRESLVRRGFQRQGVSENFILVLDAVKK